MLAQASTAFAQMRALTAQIFQKRRLVFLGRCCGGFGVGSFELGMAGLAVMNVAEEIEIVVEEV